jgi:hypothetical protein
MPAAQKESTNMNVIPIRPRDPVLDLIIEGEAMRAVALLSD